MTKPEQYEIQEATLCMARLLDKYHLNKLLDQLYILDAEMETEGERDKQ